MEPKESAAPQKERVTLRDIAHRVGVSHMTVSRALRNDPSIPPPRRREIQKVAEEMAYEPDPFLSSLVAYRFRMQPHKIQSEIAWINAWAEPQRLRQHREFDAYWRGAATVAKKYGFRLEEICWPANCTAKRLRQILLVRNIRGVLFPPQWPPRDWGQYDWNNVSMIRFGTSVRTPDVHVVTSDGFRAVQTAVRKIKDYGYQRIGLIVSMDFDGSLGGNLYGGFLAAQEILELKPVLRLLKILRDPKQKPENQFLLDKWMRSERPDAILTCEPQIPNMLGTLGYRIPYDVAVAGTSVSDIPVTAGIDQNSEEIGRVAVEMLVSQIHMNQRGVPRAPCRILVEGFWQDGTSLPDKRTSQVDVVPVPF
jgi:DNA-binding LacI/PurR family transcriptional regulator